MGRTGESVRRLAPNGFTPSWFPDGRQIVYSTRFAGNVEARGGEIGELWSVDTAGGEPRRIFEGDAMQPQVSPKGLRIAFWRVPFDPVKKQIVGSNRDLWTVAADGSNPVRVTDDAPTDWNPVWSPDGRWLYFLSNRSGSMNLWRIAIEEGSGATKGVAHPLSAPAPYIRNFTLSADGRIAAYATWAVTNNLARVRFDERTASVQGVMEAITTGPRDFGQLAIRPDGKQIVVGPSARLQEDLYLLTPDGGASLYLTNDAFRDRNAQFLPDGRRIIFYSDRGGSYDLWSIDRDGSGLRRLTTTDGRFFPVPSPDGSRVVAVDIRSNRLFMYDAADFSRAPEELAPFPAELRGPNLTAQSWSPDGKKLAGFSSPTLWVYSFDTKEYHRVPNGGASPQWFPDSNRILITGRGRVFVTDWLTGNAREILSVPGEQISVARFSSDGWLYFLHGTSSGDVWVVRFGD